MASIIEGFEYDLFISYRQNDNKYDGWVTEFVTKLTQELEAVMKDKVSIYFDTNPKDGILETHQVDQTITTKLKSLIFLPIISQTYCDTKSFAWNNEFLAYRNEADNDKIGRNVLLTNGNTASRIFPVKIHNIESDDVRLLEKELSGMMRSIDFIYHSAGVNRPLRAKDDDLIESNHQVLYRNQINKVANAVKDIIQGIKAFNSGKIPNTTITEAPNQDNKSISTTAPESIRVTVIQDFKPTIYLAWTSADLKAKREEMALILQKAGFNVVPNFDCPADDDIFKEKALEELKNCNGSLHVISGEFGRRFELDDETSFPQFQLEQAMELSRDETNEFHTFVWSVPAEGFAIKPAQQAFINGIRNNITKNMMFSNAAGPMQLVDDMRSVLKKKEVTELDTKDTDIFFIFSQQDESEAQRITDIISTEYPVESLNILPDGEEEYREMSRQQIPKSKLAVVYFKYAADWALPFIKQIWKQVGGASSPTPLMLVGDSDPPSNLARTFKAPKVVSTIVPNDNVPEEVKKVFIKVIKI